MLINAAGSVKTFCRGLCVRVGIARQLREHVLLLVMAIIAVQGKRSLAALGACMVRLHRYRGQLSRGTRNTALKTRDMYKQAFVEAIAAVDKPRRRGGRRWLLAVDDVSTLRGGFAKIDNGVRKGKKDAKHVGRRGKGRAPSQSHLFVVSLLITDTGVRIPTPRLTYRTKEYAKQIGKPFVKRPALVVQQLEWLKPLLPKDVELVVVADEAYECKAVMDACRKFGFVFVAPVDTHRCFADRTLGSTIVARGRSLPEGAFRRHVLVRGKESTVSYRRYTPDERRRNETRTFRVSDETQDVAGLGKVRVVYSFKNPVYRPRRDATRETYKVLICSDSSWKGEEVVEFYDLRWQVELLYRELKSGLGIDSYTGTDFHAFERLFDMTLLSFLFLELRRLQLLKVTKAKVDRGRLLGSRTAALKAEVIREATEGDVKWLRTAVSNPKRRREVLDVLERLRRAS